MESVIMDETKIKHDPDDPLNDQHAIFILQNAEVKEEGEAVPKVECNVCEAIFPGSLALFDHLQEHANAMFDDKSDDGAPAAATTEANDKVACDFVSSLETERDTRPKAVSMEISDLPETLEETGFKCDYCSSSFPRKWGLIRHFELDHKAKSSENQTKNGTSLQSKKTMPGTNALKKVHEHTTITQREKKQTFVCSYCKERNYSTKTALQIHIYRVHNVSLGKNTICKFRQQIYTCDICTVKFKTKQTLIEHFQRKHNFKIPNVRSRRFICELCNLNFSSHAKVLQHRKSKEHLGQIKAKNALSCPKCFKTFDTLKEMIAHKKYRHSFIQCDYCGLKAQTPRLMHMHVLYHACLKRDEKTGYNSWNCNVCKNKFSKREDFYTHHKSAHTYSRFFRCPECFTNLGLGKKSHWGIVQSHLAAHKRGYNGFYCFECRKLGTQYIDHQKRHNQPYMCTQCGKRFSNYSTMQEHNRMVHLKYENYPCEVCGKNFLNKGTRYQHLKMVHTKIEFTCDICGIKKKQKGLMSRHMASHQQKVQKPLVCGTCGKDFWTKPNLQRHELTHSGVKPFSCSVCSRAFNQLDSMKRHMRQHTGEEPYKCKDCGKGFKQTASLKAHIHVHHNPDRKRCEICEKSFRNDVALRKHLEDHVRQGNNKKKPERKTKCSAKGDKKKRNTSKSTKK